MFIFHILSKGNSGLRTGSAHVGFFPFYFLSYTKYRESIVIVKKIDFEIFVEISVLGSPKKWFLQNVCLYVCMSVCLYNEFVGKLLDRFSPNLHHTCKLALNRSSEEYF